MRPRRDGGRKSAGAGAGTGSPRRSRPAGESIASSGPLSSTRLPASLVEDPVFLADDEDSELFVGVGGRSAANPRSFPYSVKQQCWDKAEKVKGRDPDRWRRDALGNIVFRKLVGCPGCLCHDYDHIVPYSKVRFLPISMSVFLDFFFFLKKNNNNFPSIFKNILLSGLVFHLKSFFFPHFC